MRLVLTLAAFALLGVAAPASAIELVENRLTLNTFGEWGYAVTRGSDYILGTPRGEYDNYALALQLTARPVENVVISSMAYWHNREGHSEATIDFAFVEWRFNDMLRFRAGKIRQPLGLFNETREVGTTHAFFFLPQSIYGPGLTSAEAYVGAGAQGSWQRESGWGLSYDVYGGGVTMSRFEPFAKLEGEGVVLFENIEGRELLGGRLALLTPLEGFSLRLSAFRTQLTPEDGGAIPLTTGGLSLHYETEKFSTCLEAFHTFEGTDESQLSGYFEVSYRFLWQLQLAARAELTRVTLEGVPDDPLMLHRELGLGLNYWFSPDFVVKLSYHNVYGNRFAFPFVPEADRTVPTRTQMFVVGTQFSY